MGTYLITYKHIGGKKEFVVEMPSLVRLVNWIAKNADKCDSVLIQRCGM